MHTFAKNSLNTSALERDKFINWQLISCFSIFYKISNITRYLMGLFYKLKYTIDLNPINHMMTRLVNRDF